MTSPNPVRDEAEAVDTAAEMRHYMQTGEKVPAEVIGRWRALINKCEALSAAKPPASGVDAVRTEPPYRPLEDFLDWAGGRWEAEVKNRPLNNVHRRALDTTWRQVIRKLGADPEALFGPAHDDLVDAQQAGATGPKLSLSDDDREIVASALRASLSPAATSGSEDGGDWRSVLTDMVAAMYRYGHEIGDGDIPSAHRNLLSRAEQLLAKPSSPAGGDVREREAFEAWVNETPHPRFNLARGDGSNRVFGTGYVDYSTVHAWNAWKARAALSPSTSAAEPVAWLTKWQFKAPDYPVKYPGGGSSITRDATEAAQELANKQRWDRVDWVRQTPLYAHPAPAAVESAQGGRCLVTGNPVGTDTWQVGHPCRCANCASLATEKEG